MVSKTQKQKQRRKANEGLPPAIPQAAQPLSSKNTRKNVRHKQKIRMGHENPYDIYEELVQKDQARLNKYVCPTCGTQGRTMNFCTVCAAKSVVPNTVLSNKEAMVASVVPSVVAVKKVVKTKA